MLMLDRAVPVAVPELARIPCPEPTDTWTPIPHVEVVETLTKRAEKRGLVVRDSRFTLADGALYPEPGERVEIRGARLFGRLDLEPIPGVEFPDGCIPSLGVRNSTDKSYALSILAGARVLVCWNVVAAYPRERRRALLVRPVAIASSRISPAGRAAGPSILAIGSPGPPSFTTSRGAASRAAPTPSRARCGRSPGRRTSRR